MEVFHDTDDTAQLRGFLGESMPLVKHPVQVTAQGFICGTVTQPGNGGLVQDRSAAFAVPVGDECAIEEPARGQFDSECIDKHIVCPSLVQFDLGSIIYSRPAYDRRYHGVFVKWQDKGGRCIRHERTSPHPLSVDPSLLYDRCERKRHRNEPLRVHPQVPVPDVVELAVHDAGADDQGDRDHELARDQCPARTHVAGVPGQRALERLYRSESGQVKRGVASRYQSDHDAGHRHGAQDEPRGTRVQRNGFTRYHAEPGQHGRHQQQRDAYAQPAHDQGFAQELPHHLAAGRAEYLPQSDFTGPPRGPGGRQVHEIDAGDEDDKRGDGGK